MWWTRASTYNFPVRIAHLHGNTSEACLPVSSEYPTKSAKGLERTWLSLTSRCVNLDSYNFRVEMGLWVYLTLNPAFSEVISCTACLKAVPRPCLNTFKAGKVRASPEHPSHRQTIWVERFPHYARLKSAFLWPPELISRLPHLYDVEYWYIT